MLLALPSMPSAVALHNGTRLGDVVPDARFVVLLDAQRGDDIITCTGALVAPNVVLTAGHCVFGAAAVTVAPVDISTGAKGTPVSARVWTAHPLWAGDSMGRGWDARITAETAARYVDLGLVLLNGPLAGTMPIALATPAPHPSLVLTMGLARDPKLERRTAVNAATALVTGPYGGPAVFRMMGEGGLAWCPGDSGGPVLERTPAGLRLRAVVGLGTMALSLDPESEIARHWGGAGHAPRCGRVASAIDVTHHLTWIEQTLDILAPHRPSTLAGLRR